MRYRLLPLFIGCMVFISACVRIQPLAEPLREQIEFESVSLPGRLWDPFAPPLVDGKPVTISGLLNIPATEKPVPAVIITHGCAGVGGGEMSWVDTLGQQGIATFVVNSFAGRRIGQICSGEETINVFSPIADVYRAAELLTDNPYIDGSRLAVMGFSFGGRAAIWSAYSRFQEEYGGEPFLGYMAFYPSTCFIHLQHEDAISGGPIRIFHGTADDWTPIDQCQDMIDRMKDHGVDADLYAYPGALHAFDNPGLAWAERHFILAALSPRNCTFVEDNGRIIDPETGGVAGVGSPCVESGVSYGYDRDARQAAQTRLIDFLSEIFQLQGRRQIEVTPRSRPVRSPVIP